MSKAKDFFGHWAVKNLLGILGVYLAVILVAAVGLGLFTRHGKEIKVPDFTNMSVPQAQALARTEKLKVLVADSVYVRRMAPGSVYRQSPPAGSGVKQGRKIRLVINAVTPKMVTVPNVVGYSLRQATAEIIGAGLRVGRLRYEDDFATNNVLGQYCGGKPAEAGSRIESDAVIDLTLGVNRRENATSVPDVLGLHMLQAADVLHDNSLNVGRMVFDRDIRDYNDSLNAVVWRQSPDVGPGQVRLGVNINLYLTLDPEKVPVRAASETPEE